MPSPVTIDLDATDVEVYGRRKRGVAYNHQGQRCGRPHVATWAETETVLAAELLSGNDDPRASAAGFAAAARGLPCRQAREGPGAGARRCGLFRRGTGPCGAGRHGVRDRRQAHRPAVAAAGRPHRGRLGDAIGMAGAQVAVADYRPVWWPSGTSLLIRRVRLDLCQVSADARSRRRRTLHPGQRALPLDELAKADAIYGYSFVLTNLDVSTKDKAAAVEHWYRHRTTVENIFRDSKHGAALRHLPSGYQVNTAWMWGALLAATMAAWLHQLTATTRGEHPGRLGHPRRQSHDRHPPAPPHQHPCPARFPCRANDPAAATRPRPARRNPRPTPGPPRDTLTTGRYRPDQEPRTPQPGRQPGLAMPTIRHNPQDQHPPKRSTQPATRGFGSEETLCHRSPGALTYRNLLIARKSSGSAPPRLSRSAAPHITQVCGYCAGKGQWEECLSTSSCRHSIGSSAMSVLQRRLRDPLEREFLRRFVAQP